MFILQRWENEKRKLEIASAWQMTDFSDSFIISIDGHFWLLHPFSEVKWIKPAEKV